MVVAAPSETRPVVIYDGDCPFCRKQVARIRSMEKPGTFEYVPRQASGVEDRFPILRSADFNTGMRLIEPNGRVSVGADAVYQIARRLPGWRVLAGLYRVPGIRQVCQAAYDWIARNRYRLTRKQCEDGVCKL